MITSHCDMARHGASHRNHQKKVRGTNFLEEFEQTAVDFDEADLKTRMRAARGGAAADYLALRATNDQMRERGVGALIDAFTALAGEANRRGASVMLARTEAHRFSVGNSTMVGPKVVLTNGVRSLTIEAGWPRMPRDGIVRGQGLACARITHFGDRTAGEDLLLVLDEAGAPLWLSVGDGRTRAEFLEESLRRHLLKLLN